MLSKNYFLFFFYSILFFAHFGYAGGDIDLKGSLAYRKLLQNKTHMTDEVFVNWEERKSESASDTGDENSVTESTLLSEPIAGSLEKNQEGLVYELPSDQLKSQYANNAKTTDQDKKNPQFLSNQPLLIFSAGGMIGFCAGILIHKLYLYIDDRSNNVRSARIWRGVKKQASGFKRLLQIISFSIA